MMMHLERHQLALLNTVHQEGEGERAGIYLSEDGVDLPRKGRVAFGGASKL